MSDPRELGKAELIACLFNVACTSETHGNALAAHIDYLTERVMVLENERSTCYRSCPTCLNYEESVTP